MQITNQCSYIRKSTLQEEARYAKRHQAVSSNSISIWDLVLDTAIKAANAWDSYYLNKMLW